MALPACLSGEGRMRERRAQWLRRGIVAALALAMTIGCGVGGSLAQATDPPVFGVDLGAFYLAGFSSIQLQCEAHEDCEPIVQRHERRAYTVWIFTRRNLLFPSGPRVQPVVSVPLSDRS